MALAEEFSRGRKMLVIQVERERFPTGLYIHNALLVGLGIRTGLCLTHSFWARQKQRPRRGEGGKYHIMV